MRVGIYSGALAVMLALTLTNASNARVTRFVIERHETVPPAVPGAPAYEILHGHFYGELSPSSSHNAIITDLVKAPRNAHGLVEYSATFMIAKPLDMKLSSSLLIYDVVNRGNVINLGNSAFGADKDGNIRVVSGWQGDIPPNGDYQTATVPVAPGVTGEVLVRFMNMPDGTKSLPIMGGFSTQVPQPHPISLKTDQAMLFRQTSDSLPTEKIASNDWAFADCTKSPFPGITDPTKICLRGGFNPSFAYTLVYRASNPKVLGIGFAVTRDLNSFLRYATEDDDGRPNPVASAIRWAIAVGSSQSGNFLKTYVNLGFNADEQNRIVFDGMNVNIAARQVPLNIRFGIPGGGTNLYELGSEGTLWWTRYDDEVRHRGVTSLLDRCTASNTCPKIFETFDSTELWGLRMSPNLIGTDAKADLPLPANVRRYYFPSVSHGGGIGGFSSVGEQVPAGFPKCTLPLNPNPSSDTMRALFEDLLDWVKNDTDPPPSRYPTLARHELVEPNATAMGWPAIPNAPIPDGAFNPFYDYDVGDQFRYPDESGIVTLQPPQIRRVIPSLVPRVNSDGNETAGIPSVQLLVPLGTYTGWNKLAEGYGKGSSCDFLLGGFIPFARTAAERIAAHDPRPSLEERYGNHEGFVDQVRAVVAAQVKAGWLRPDDGDRLVREAEQSDVLINK